jgi:ATP-dependent Clp protease ATP-binding subunit ClpC
MQSPEITQKFSTRLKQVLAYAEESASEFSHMVVDTDHLLFALRVYQGSVAAEILKTVGLKIEPARLAISKNHRAKPSGSAKSLSYTGQARRAIVRATWTAGQNHHHFVGTEHLLSALITQRESQARKILADLKVDLQAVRHQLKLVLRGTSHFPDITETLHLRVAPPAHANKNQTPLLDEFGIDLNQRALDHKTDPIIGRDTELARLIDVLERRTKNNAVLVGEPGVGKTAIVEGLARKIVTGEVPAMLIDKKVIQLDLTTLLAGTSYRGDFEDRLTRLLKEVEKAGNIVLFIDEIHTIVGTGSVGGSLDAANMLKSVLARGEIRVIGATTPQEYKQHIERDAALDRRFQVIPVQEVSAKEASQILIGLQPLYEKFHGVKLERGALTTAVELSSRYMPERFLPDKAIDVIDEAMARKKIESIRSIQTGKGGVRERLHVLSSEVDQLVLEERYKEAIRNQRRAARLRLRLKNQPASVAQVATVDQHDIARVVARITGIPSEQLLHTEAKRLMNLARNLRRRIVGQRHAIDVVADTLLRARAGLQDPNRPLGTFLFLGPSGVGKTELAKALAQEVYQSSRALIRVDMSEFSERFTVSRLLGSPPGYVGYGEGGRLTEAVRRTPYSVVLFDEIEKAHPDVMSILLQIFEDGQLTDGAGKIVSFKNTICVLTSNVGNRYVGRGDLIGFGEHATSTRATKSSQALELKRALQDQFRPELLGRIDHVVVFHRLAEQDLRKIFELEFQKISARAKLRGVTLDLSPSLVDAALTQRDPDNGARFIRKFLQEIVEPRIAEQLVGEKKVVGSLSLGWQRGRVSVTSSS